MKTEILKLQRINLLLITFLCLMLGAMYLSVQRTNDRNTRYTNAAQAACNKISEYVPSRLEEVHTVLNGNLLKCVRVY